jgi:hypothetical protein
MKSNLLKIPDQWIILALDFDTGKIKLPLSIFECGITAGILLELAISNHIGVSLEKKITVVDQSPVEDPLLNKALDVIAKSKEPQAVLNWMIRLTMQNSQTIESFYFKQLLGVNILRKETRQVLGIFRSPHYYATPEDTQSKITVSLEKLIQQQTQKEIRSLCLLGLVANSGQAGKILGEKEASLLSINSTSIFSKLESRRLPNRFIAVFGAVLEALKLSQQSAGELSS